MDYQIPDNTRIGHVHIKVLSLEKIEEFYVGLLGFEIQARLPGALFVSAGAYHHHLAFNTWDADHLASPTGTGLYHVAINYPTRKDLAIVLKRLIDANWPIAGASDHGTHEAIYIQDPEDNGLELAWDRPKDQWPLLNNGQLDTRQMLKPLDFESLMHELDL